ncbi:MAG: hypothetical protein AAGJ84_10370 [Pseudomonadota bacterium]
MLTAIKTVFYFGPLLFAVGFLIPLIAQIILALGWTAPFGLSAWMFAGILGGAYGVFAQITGRWL